MRLGLNESLKELTTPLPVGSDGRLVVSDMGSDGRLVASDMGSDSVLPIILLSRWKSILVGKITAAEVDVTVDACGKCRLQCHCEAMEIWLR